MVNANLVLAGTGGGGASGVELMWVAPIGSTAPVNAVDDLPAAWESVGFVSADGASLGVDESSQDITAFGTGVPVRTLVTASKHTVSVTCLETNPKVLEVFSRQELDAVIPDAQGDFGYTEGTVPTRRYAIVIELVDGENRWRRYYPSAEVTERQEQAIATGEAATYGLTVTAYPGTDGVAVVNFYRIPGLVEEYMSGLWEVRSVTASTDATADDLILVNATGGAVSITLPSVAGGNSDGVSIAVKKTDSSTNAVTIVGIVDGATNPTLTVQNHCMFLACDGTMWRNVSTTTPAAIGAAPAIVDYDAGETPADKALTVDDDGTLRVGDGATQGGVVAGAAAFAAMDHVSQHAADGDYPITPTAIGAVSTGGSQDITETARLTGLANLGITNLPQVDKVAALTLPARGYFSGVGDGIHSPAGGDGGFGAWRGDPTDFISVWVSFFNYTTPMTPGSVELFESTGLIDVACMGPNDGWVNSAAGSHDEVLAEFLTALRAKRTIDGVVMPTIVRPYHEMNGTWYAWSVYRGAVDDFKATARRWRRVQNAVFPEAIWAFSPNAKNSSGIPSATLWEDGIYDCIAVEPYNTEISEDGYSWAEGIMLGTDDDPSGLERWRQFAEARGMAIYFPEYGSSSLIGDDTTWINGIIPWIAANKGSGPGQLFAESYFQGLNDGATRWLLGDDGVLPNVSAAYVAAHQPADLTAYSWDLQLEAEDLELTDGQAVETWTGTAGSATQATADNRPAFFADGPTSGIGRVHFDGTNDTLTSTLTGLPGDKTIVMVVRPDALPQGAPGTAQYCPAGASAAGGLAFIITCPVVNAQYVNPYQGLYLDAAGWGAIGSTTGYSLAEEWHLLTATYESPGVYEFRIDGVTVGTGTSTQITNSSSSLCIGSSVGAKFYPGDVAAIFAKKEILTATQLADAERAIMAKYGITPASPAVPESKKIAYTDALSPLAALVSSAVALVVDDATIDEGGTAAFTATASLAHLSEAPEGSIVFTDDLGTVLGTVELSAGVAVLATTALAVGDRAVSAAYVPATGAPWSTSTSPAVTVTVAAA